MLDAYRTGRGSVKLRAVAEITESRSGADQIVVTEIPYQTSVGGIEMKIADAIDSGELTGISGVQNDSAGRVSRLVITLKRDANANVVLNNLYKHTPLQTSFGVHMLALVDGVPRLLNLAQALNAYVAHQVEVVTRRSEFRLRKALARAHIVEGLLRAIDMLDAVIATIRASEDRPAARTSLMASSVLLLRGAGESHPRHDSWPSHTARPERARDRDRPAAERPWQSSRRSWLTPSGSER